MDREQRDRLQKIVRQLVRQPPPVEQSDLRSALNLLCAARSDAAWLLLNRVMVLENALAQAASVSAAGADPAPAAPVPAVAAPGAGSSGSSTLRDAALLAGGVAGGVVAGGLLLGALGGLDGDGGDAFDVDL